MEKKFRLLLLLALLMTAATGAWAQEQSETIETASTTGTTVYTGEHFKITASLSCDGAGIVLAKPSNNGGKATIEALNGEMITKVEMHLRYGGTYATKTTATKGELVATDKTGENDISVINVNANSVVIGTTQSGSWIQVNKFVVYYSVPPTYTVSLKEGTKDAANWTISPSKATTDGVAEGTEVTLQYNGRLKVKGVKATSDAAPAAPATVDLDASTKAWADGSAFAVPAGGLTYSDAITVSGDVTLTLTEGTTLTLNKGISLAAGATLTVEGNGTMVVNGTSGSTASTVAGSGTLVLMSGTLTATGGNGGSVGQFTDDSHGGNGGDAINGSVIVSGGTLTARGGNGGSVGDYCENCSGGNGGDAISGTLTINGGSTSVNDGSNGSIGNLCGDCTAGTGGKAVTGNVTDNRN